MSSSSSSCVWRSAATPDSLAACIGRCASWHVCVRAAASGVTHAQHAHAMRAPVAQRTMRRPRPTRACTCCACVALCQVWLLGRVLHVRHLVWRDRAGGARPQLHRRRGCAQGVRLPGVQAAPGRRLGRELPQLPGQGAPRRMLPRAPRGGGVRRAACAAKHTLRVLFVAHQLCAPSPCATTACQQLDSASTQLWLCTRPARARWRSLTACALCCALPDRCTASCRAAATSSTPRGR